MRFSDFKVVNVLAVCSMPFQIRLIEFTKNNRPIASYEPELHPAASYRIKNLRSTVQVFSTGNITVTGPNVQSVASAVEQIYPLLFECQKTRSWTTHTHTHTRRHRFEIKSTLSLNVLRLVTVVLYVSPRQLLPFHVQAGLGRVFSESCLWTLTLVFGPHVN